MVVMIAGPFLTGRPAIPIASAEATSCGCVVFRLDDVQDRWLTGAQLAVMDSFISRNQTLTAGIIMNHIGTDQFVTEKLVEGHNKGLFEFAIHGWDHEPFPQLTKSEQIKTLEMSQERMFELFGHYSDVFIPPYNDANEKTYEAAAELGIAVVSTKFVLDKHFQEKGMISQVGDDKVVYHVPVTAAFKDTETEEQERAIEKRRKYSIDELTAQIDDSIQKYGYAAVMLHPQDFVRIEDGAYTKVIDTKEIDDLVLLLDSLKIRGIAIAKYANVVGIEHAHPLVTSKLGLEYVPNGPANIFTLGTGPSGIAVNELTNRIYVVNSASDSISMIDGSDNVVIDTISIGSIPFGVTINPSRNLIYAINWYSDSISVIDGESNRIIGNIEAGSVPFGIDINTVTGRIYVLDTYSNSILVFDDQNNVLLRKIKLEPGLIGIAVNSATNKIYVTNSITNTVTILNGDIGETEKLLSIQSPERIAVNSATNKIYVTSSETNTATVIDGSEASVIRTLAIPERPLGIAVNSATNKIYVTSADENIAVVLDGNKDIIEMTVAVGKGPAGIAVNSITGKVYIANVESNSVTVIDETRLASVPEFGAAAVPTILFATILVTVVCVRRKCLS
jgi:YVTN family beta-propeller protein